MRVCSSRRASILLLLGVFLSGCMRVGFDQQGTGDAARDAPLAGDAARDAPLAGDAARDVLLADLGPADLDGAALDTPRTAEGPKATAGVYESCSVLPCKSGLICVTGTTSVCMRPCGTTVLACSTGETCYTITSQKLCSPRCTTSSDCPKGMSCIGDGPYPLNHCAPVSAGGGVLSKCCCTLADVCKADHRCLGLSGQQHYCYETCPAGTCPAKRQCVKRTGVDFCLRTCSPFDAPSPCVAGKEVCLVGLISASKTAHCYPAAGSATTCGGSTVCASGMICVGTTCRKACDAAHPCSPGPTCTPLSNGWKACL